MGRYGHHFACTIWCGHSPAWSHSLLSCLLVLWLPLTDHQWSRSGKPLNSLHLMVFLPLCTVCLSHQGLTLEAAIWWAERNNTPSARPQQEGLETAVLSATALESQQHQAGKQNFLTSGLLKANCLVRNKTVCLTSIFLTLWFLEHFNADLTKPII